MLFDEGDTWIIIFLWLPLLVSLIVVGLIVPLGALITYLIYHFRLHYKFTWAKDYIEQEKESPETSR
jgi:hypothetical protein